NVADEFKVGDDVYIFRVFRDGTSQSFRLATEHLGANTETHQFKHTAKEAGDIRLQVFDTDGNLQHVLGSLRDTSSTSYKGLLGIAGIEVDQAGNLFILDSDSGTITKFNAEGDLMGSFGSLGSNIKEFIDPTGIALDSEGNLYVADTGNARVQKFDKHGNFVGAFGSMGLLSLGMMVDPSEKPEESKQHELFERPEAVVVDQSGNPIVVDRRTGMVSVFDSYGNHMSSFGSLVTPTSIAKDSKGNLYVLEQGNSRVVKFDQNGFVVKRWGTFGVEDGTFKSPFGIAIDSKDHVYVTDSANNRIQKFDSNGKFITKWGTKGADEGEFIGPLHVAADPSDNVYVSDSGNYRIQKFDSDGNFISELRGGSDIADYMRPHALAVDSQGNLFVTDIEKKSVQKFDRDGNFVREWGSEGLGAGQFRGPFGIAVDELDNIYVADPFNRRVQKFDGDGNLLLRWGSGEIRGERSIDDMPKGEHYIALDTNSHEPIGLVDAKIVEENGRGSYFIEGGQIFKILHIFMDTVYVKALEYVRHGEPILSWTPDGIDVDSYGNVFIVDRENEVAKKFDNDGRLISKWGSTGIGDNEFTKPTAMALNSENVVYIVDTGNNRIQKFDSEGNFVAKWGSYGQEPGMFDDPRGIAIDMEDNVYVLDNGNNRIQKFDGDGNFIREWGSKGSSPGQFDNLSTEGIAVDPSGRVYVADLPGENRASHWIAEVAIPLFLKSDTFGMYLAEGTYGDYMALDTDNPNAVNIYDVYRKAWPAGTVSILPDTWAKGRLVNMDELKVDSELIIENVRNCTNEVCGDLNESQTHPVLTGNDVVVTASVRAEPNEKFEYDRVQVTLQYSVDGEEWVDADSKSVLVHGDRAGAVNLKFKPANGDYKLRVVSSGLLTEEATSDLIDLTVEESYKIMSDLIWSPDKVMQDEPTKFEVTFTGADSEVLSNLNYDLRIIKDHKAIADLPQIQTEDGKGEFRYTFKEEGQHLVQVRVVGLGTPDDFMPMKKVFTYKIDVLPVDSPIKVSTIQKGEAMKIIIKNRDMSSLPLNAITLSLSNIDKIEYRLPQSWTSSLDIETDEIQFFTEHDPLTSGDFVSFTVKSKAFTKSLYSACWDLEQSTVVLRLC
ncbi:MAG: 6-bladed beta-propeller, partial [Nitrososphaerales archaeon]